MCHDCNLPYRPSFDAYQGSFCSCGAAGGTLAERQVLGKRRREQLGLEAPQAALPYGMAAAATPSPAEGLLPGPAEGMMAKWGYTPGAGWLAVCLSVCLFGWLSVYLSVCAYVK